MTERPSQGSRGPAQYGEYATPEQQRQARGIDDEGIGDGGTGTGAGGIGGGGARDGGARDGATQGESSTPLAREPVAARSSVRSVVGHPVDRVVTMILLALGLFFLLNGIPNYLAFPAAIQDVFTTLDAGTYSAAPLAANLGIVAIVVEAGVWLGTAWVAFTAIKRGRYAWWIAALGAVLSFIAVMVIMVIALLADPSFITAVNAQSTVAAS